MNGTSDKIIKNPVSDALSDFAVVFENEIKRIAREPVYFVPSFVIVVITFLILMCLLVFWVYGLIPLMAKRIWKYVVACRNQLDFDSLLEQMPYTVAMGIYFIIWLPFAFLSLPFVIIGYIGYIISEIFSEKKVIKNANSSRTNIDRQS